MPIFTTRNEIELGRKVNISLSLRVEVGQTRLGVVLDRLASRLGARSAARKPVAQTPVTKPQALADSPRSRRRSPTHRAKVAGQNRREKRQEASELSADEVQAAIAQTDWFHRIEVAPGVTTPGVNDPAPLLEALEVPDHLGGKRILDVGARDGYFSFAAEARGAEVLAIDSVAPHLTGFETAASLLGSSVEYKTTNLYDLRPEEVGTFDGIFFLGVLYHLRDPMLGLDRMWSLARPGATLWVESFVLDKHVVDPRTGERRGDLASLAPALVDTPIAQFYPEGQLNYDLSTMWGPNLAALKAMVEAAGFTVTRALPGPTTFNRGIVIGYKKEDSRTTAFRHLDRGVVTTSEAISRLQRELQQTRREFQQIRSNPRKRR